jgi:hypothetical protein
MAGQRLVRDGILRWISSVVEAGRVKAWSQGAGVGFTSQQQQPVTLGLLFDPIDFK